MRPELRFPGELFDRLHADLSRPHSYSHERVTFLSCKPAALPGGALTLLATALHPVLDEDYERDDTVGAMLGGGAFRRVLQIAFNTPVSILHVHRHEHQGQPQFSSIDLREARRYVPDFWKVRPDHPHGIVVLSHDSANGLIWTPENRTQVPLGRISIVGRCYREVSHR